MTSKSLKSPTIVIRIETVLFLVSFVFKTIEDLSKHETTVSSFDKNHKKSKKIYSENYSQKRTYKKLSKNMKLLQTKQKLTDQETEMNQLRTLNLKLSMNYFNVTVFFSNDESGKNESFPLTRLINHDKEQIFPKINKDTQNVQGFQFVIENVSLDCLLNKTKVT